MTCAAHPMAQPLPIVNNSCCTCRWKHANPVPPLGPWQRRFQPFQQEHNHMHFGLTDEQQMIVDTVQIWSNAQARCPRKSPKTSNKKPLILGFTPVISLIPWAARGLAIWNSRWLNENWAVGPWRLIIFSGAPKIS